MALEDIASLAFGALHFLLPRGDVLVSPTVYSSLSSSFQGSQDFGVIPFQIDTGGVRFDLLGQLYLERNETAPTLKVLSQGSGLALIVMATACSASFTRQAREKNPPPEPDVQ